MENGNAKERRIAQELELLKQYQRVSVKDLAATLEVSEMTIRRDLDLLRKNHVLERSYGYATLRPKAAMAMPMMEKFMTFVWPEFKTSAKKTVLPNTPPR